MKANKASGVDEVTKEMYDKNLEENVSKLSGANEKTSLHTTTSEKNIHSKS